jgi:tetratricopeptide (TPR) repeat protein
MKVKRIESARSKDADEPSGFACNIASNSARARGRLLRPSAAAALLRAVLCLGPAAPRGAAAFDDRRTIAKNNKAYREGKKAIREGHYENAVKIYQDLLLADWQDVQAHLGISLAYLKIQNYQLCYDHANEVLKIDPKNARANALVGLAMLRSGYVKQSVGYLIESVKADPKEPLAHGAAAEIDYYEGRSKEARMKSYYAFTLDSQEPDYLFTFARASSRLEMFRDAADAYERFLTVAPKTEVERRERIKGLIRLYRQLTDVEVHEISGPRQAEIPFSLGSDRRPYMKMRINGREATFVIDTGSGFTVISKEAAKKFRVSEIARGGSSQGFGGSGKFPIVYGLLNSMHLGDIKVRSIPCFIRPFHAPKGRTGEPEADGLIGLSVLAYFLTEIDYKDSVLRLDRDVDKPLPAAVSPDVTVIPFRTTQNGLISIETQIDGTHSINAILDSAASSSVISMAAVDRLKMRDQIIKGQTVQVTGAAGVADNVELLFIRNCRVADLQQDNLRALVLDFAAINESSGFEQSGILGGDFLRNFRVTIDFIRAQVSFQPHSSSITRQ